jgi:parvulin-like peptidyl-prolyl isomerase
LDNNTLLIVVLVVIALAAFIVFNFSKEKKQGVTSVAVPDAGLTRQLQLQAYERLALLVDRIALPNLIPRVNQQNVSARDMQLLLTRSIKEEFEHNITQQIYVTADAWNAVKNLKEQNLLAINQLASALPANANGMDLNKHLLEFLMNDKKGNLHEVVSEVLSFEAKRIM